MANFVHLAPEKEIKNILRSGIKVNDVFALTSDIERGVYCMPVLQNYFATHQWNRELKRSEQNSMKAVYFKIPDDEMVLIGGYAWNNEKSFVPASEAIKLIMETENKSGLEVIIPRKITKKEITKVKDVNKNVGWRYFPKSHEYPLCVCRGCITGGNFMDHKLMEKSYNKLLKMIRTSDDNMRIKDALYAINEYICRNKVSYSKKAHFEPLLEHEDPKIVLKALDIIDRTFDKNNQTLKSLMNHPSEEVRNEVITRLEEIS